MIDDELYRTTHIVAKSIAKYLRKKKTSTSFSTVLNNFKRTRTFDDFVHAIREIEEILAKNNLLDENDRRIFATIVDKVKNKNLSNKDINTLSDLIVIFAYSHI